MKPTLSHPAISDPKAVVAVYNTHPEAEAGVKELQKGGFDTKKLSIVGKDYHTEEHVVGYYGRRPAPRSGPRIGCHRCRIGECGCRRRRERFGGCSLQRRDTERQRSKIRNRHQSEQVSSRSPWDCR